MEIESKKVWDFCKENYVNRLIMNELDGKLVEYGEYTGELEGISPDNNNEEKLYIDEDNCN
jgi:BRCA1-associated protein